MRHEIVDECALYRLRQSPQGVCGTQVVFSRAQLSVVAPGELPIDRREIKLLDLIYARRFAQGLELLLEIPERPGLFALYQSALNELDDVRTVKKSWCLAKPIRLSREAVAQLVEDVLALTPCGKKMAVGGKKIV